MNKPLFIQRLPIYLIVYWSIIIVSLASIIEDKELPTDNNDSNSLFNLIIVPFI